MTSETHDPSRTPVISPDVSAAVVDGEVVIYHFETNAALRLNAIGSLTWQCFDGVTPLDEIILDLADAFGVEPAVVREDVDALIRTLTDAGTIGWAGTTPAHVDGDRDSANTPDDAPVVLTNPPSP